MTLHHLDTCHDCGRVLHAGVFCSACLARSDHRPTPAVSPAPLVSADRLAAGDSGAVRAESTAVNPTHMARQTSTGMSRASAPRSDNDDD